MSLQLATSVNNDGKLSPELMLADRTRFAIEQSKEYVKKKLSVSQAFTNLSDYFEQGQSRCELIPLISRNLKRILGRDLSNDPLSGYLRLYLETRWINAEPIDKEIGSCKNRRFWVIHADTKEKLYYLKTFPRDDEAYLKEIFGLDFLRRRVNGASTPKIRLLSKIDLDGEELFLLAFGVIKGGSVKELYRRISLLPPFRDVK